jgi:DNA-binding IclR family transcriptional regulator
MIQVIKRTYRILELLKDKGALSLNKVQQETRINKTTLSNILKTLCNLGFTEREEGGIYKLGRFIYDLAFPELQKRTIQGLAEQHVMELAELTKEAAVVAVCDRLEIIIAAKAVYEQNITVNTSAVQKYHPYSTATGRTFVAYQDEEIRKLFIEKYGLPKQEWLEASTKTGMKKECKRIRKQGIVFKANDELQALGVPVFGPEGNIWAAVGVYLPRSRFKGEHKEMIVAGIERAGQKMTRMLGDPKAAEELPL